MTGGVNLPLPGSNRVKIGFNNRVSKNLNLLLFDISTAVISGKPHIRMMTQIFL